MNKLPQILIVSGCLLIVASLILFVFIFAPVAKVEVNYALNKPKNLEIKPIDKEFGIVIPKIGANAKIIANVDPYNTNTYQKALTKGVAQARGTAMPDDEIGNMFLFSHSSANILEATRYNSVFYLLSKLKKDDEIDIYYKQKKYKYKVSEIKLVDAKDVSYLNPRLPQTASPHAKQSEAARGTGGQAKSDIRSLILMTCWPPGTTYKRLLVIAEAF